MLVLRADDVVGAVGFQVGGELFVENLGALVGSQNCGVAGEVGYESLVSVDVVVLRGDEFDVLASTTAIYKHAEVLGSSDALRIDFAGKIREYIHPWFGGAIVSCGRGRTI